MANDIDKSMKDAAKQTFEYIKNAATMTVETKYVQITEGAMTNFAQASPGARTIIRLDGDSETIIPMRQGPNGELEIDTELFSIHERNVSAATTYRANMLEALLKILQ